MAVLCAKRVESGGWNSNLKRKPRTPTKQLSGYQTIYILVFTS